MIEPTPTAGLPEHECVFVEECEPTGRLVLPPCLICGLAAMDALEQLRKEAVMSEQTCPVCGDVVTLVEKETEVREEYADGIGPPGERGRTPRSRSQRRMVPGRSVTTFHPCGHKLAR